MKHKLTQPLKAKHYRAESPYVCFTS